MVWFSKDDSTLFCLLWPSHWSPEFLWLQIAVSQLPRTSACKYPALHKPHPAEGGMVTFIYMQLRRAYGHVNLI